MAGTAMLYLFPRFFAESFYNIKDLMFIAVFIIALFCMVKVLKNKRKLVWCILFSIVCAFATNTRVIGVMLLPALLMSMLIEDIVRKAVKDPDIKNILLLPEYNGKFIALKRILPYIVICIIFILSYIAITPASWHNPANYIKGTFLEFSDYSLWDGTMLFGGNSITLEQRPWFYIPVWMGITVPLFYLAMFGVGIVYLFGEIIKHGIKTLVTKRYIWIIFLLFLAPLLAGMIFNITIYMGWRHVYFLFIPFLLVAIYGIGQLQKKVQESKIKFAKKIVPIITAVVLAVNAGRIIANHPYQNTMFNEIGISVADQFDRDYWGLTYMKMAEYLLQSNQSDFTVYSNTFFITYNLLTEEQKQRIMMVMPNTADYILYNFRDTTGNDYTVKGFAEIYAIWQDGYKIGTILKRTGPSLKISPEKDTVIDSDRVLVQVSYVTDKFPSGIKEIFFGVYNEEDGPYKYVQYSANDIGNGSYAAEINIADLSNKTGKYIINTWVTDNNGKMELIGYTSVIKE